MPSVLPEKTLEHWVSLYINYRYQSHANLWWPAHGEDIKANSLPPKSGKFVLFEIKTAEFDASRHHISRVVIDVAQWRRYSQRDEPVAYVFPIPHWSGLLLDQTLPTPHITPDLAFSRVGSPYWFIDWTRVLSVDEVGSIIGQSGQQQATATLVSVNFNNGNHTIENRGNMPKPVWGRSKTKTMTPPNLTEYLANLESCGGTGQVDVPLLGQIIRLPENLVGREDFEAANASQLLREASDQLLREASEFSGRKFIDYRLVRAENRFVPLAENESLVSSEPDGRSAGSVRAALFIDSSRVGLVN